MWNKNDEKYKTIKSTGCPSYDMDILTSARQLLELTRLRDILPYPILSYIIDDFYDERNSMMHGNIKFITKKETASYSLLLLYSFLHSIKDY